MATATVTKTFVANTAAKASEVNANFSDVLAFLNGSVVQKDGSIAMTGLLTLSGAPTSALHAATKTYVDGKQPTGATVGTSQTTASATFTNLATTGPTVTVTTGTSALIVVSARIISSSTAQTALMGVAVTGASTVSATDYLGPATSSAVGGESGCFAYVLTGLTAGSNVFTAKYRSTSGTATFSQRNLMVVPL